MNNDATAISKDSIAIEYESSAINGTESPCGEKGPTGSDGIDCYGNGPGRSGTSRVLGTAYNGSKWYDPCVRKNSKRRKLRK
jgi:hypothetical protein